MNLIYEKLPESVEVDGVEYEIVTDFRDWLKFIELSKDADIDEEVKVFLFLDWFKNEVPDNIEKALSALADFLLMKTGDDDKKKEIGKNKRVLSYSFDAPYIVAGFQECYQIDLQSIEYMHWWKFQILFQGLNENTEIMKRIAYRSIDAGSIKDREERERIRKIQRSIALPQEVISDYEIGNAFA